MIIKSEMLNVYNNPLENIHIQNHVMYLYMHLIYINTLFLWYYAIFINQNNKFVKIKCY